MTTKVVEMPTAIATHPLEFSIDPDTKLLALRARTVGVAGPIELQVQVELVYRLLLAPQVTQSLLSSLHELQTLLERAIATQPKPSSLQ